MPVALLTDFRIFLCSDENPYDALAFIAEQLGINEGLSLNVGKTTVYSRTEFLSRLKNLVTDVTDQAEGAALESLTSDLYFDDEPDPAELEKLKSMNLLSFLQDEVGNDAFDMGRIKVIFRALKIAKPPEAIEYLATNFSELVVFAKEMVGVRLLRRHRPARARYRHRRNRRAAARRFLGSLPQDRARSHRRRACAPRWFRTERVR